MAMKSSEVNGFYCVDVQGGLVDVWCYHFFCCSFSLKIVLQLPNGSIGARKRSSVHIYCSIVYQIPLHYLYVLIKTLSEAAPTRIEKSRTQSPTAEYRGGGGA